MARIAYSVSSIGLGHATRAVAVSSELARRGHNVTFISSGLAADLIESYGFRVIRAVSHPNPWVVTGRMILPSVWYIRYWYNYKRAKKAVRKLLSFMKPDVVVCDEEFASLVVAKEIGLRAAAITDELYLGFARNRLSAILERKIQRWYSSVLEIADMLIIPEKGISNDRIFYVGKIVRQVSGSREEIRLKYGLPSGSTIILFTMSGSQLGMFLLKKTVDEVKKLGLENVVLAVSGSKSRIKHKGVIDLGIVRDNHELVYASDLVVSTAGKSTIDEALVFGTPLIAVPIAGHYEQERNAEELGFRAKDIERLGELIRINIGMKKKPENTEGSLRAAILIEKLALQ